MDRENNPEQTDITNTLREIAKTTKTHIVATPDAHYCKKEDAFDQRVLLCNNLRTTMNDINKKY